MVIVFPTVTQAVALDWLAFDISRNFFVAGQYIGYFFQDIF
jgi:hypothetical protein